MEIFLNILFFVVGIAILIKGSDLFIDGTIAVAKRLKVSAMFIGLTIVAFGTSVPELAICIANAINNSLEMSVGNVVGSNMFSMLFALGGVAIVAPIQIEKSNKKLDLPFFILTALMLLIFSCDVIFGADTGYISRIESLILFLILIVYFIFQVLTAKNVKKIENEQKDIVQENVEKKNDEKILSVKRMVFYIIIGIVLVGFGGECVSVTAEFLAGQLGMSEKLIGLTVVAFVASMPELVTSVIAIKKGENALALGNIIGSNIINICLILALVGLIQPIVVSNAVLIDLIILAVSSVLFSIFCITRSKLARQEGVVMVVIYVLYIVFSIIRNYILLF